MSNDELLDGILGMLRAFKDNRHKLEKLHQYIIDELYEEPQEEDISVPQKYRELVKEIAEYLDTGMICYINSATMELLYIPENFDVDDSDEENPFIPDMKRVENESGKFIKIEPPASPISFGLMERFASSLTNAHYRTTLENALQKKKPFRNFNAIIHELPVREDWFAFKQKSLEAYVAKELTGELPDF